MVASTEIDYKEKNDKRSPDKKQCNICFKKSNLQDTAVFSWGTIYSNKNLD